MPPLPSRFTFTPASPFSAGTTVRVCFNNPDLAGQTISIGIELTNGSTSSQSLQLDAQGNGCFDWVAPSADGAVFSQPTSADEIVVIT